LGGIVKKSSLQNFIIFVSLMGGFTASAKTLIAQNTVNKNKVKLAPPPPIEAADSDGSISLIEIHESQSKIVFKMKRSLFRMHHILIFRRRKDILPVTPEN
jgi:hypothetical protein